LGLHRVFAQRAGANPSPIAYARRKIAPVPRRHSR
jgi:hypothetical protein